MGERGECMLDYYGLMTLTKRLLASLALLAWACVPASAATKEAEIVNSELTGPLFYEILVGELSAQDGDAGTGYALLLDAARNTRSQALFERAVQLALGARDGTSALHAAQAWSQALPQSREASQYVIQILIGLNRIAETAEPIRRSLAPMAQGERAAAISLLPRYFSRATDRKLAAATLEQALAGELGSKVTGPAAWACIGAMRLMAQDTAAALAAAQKGGALNSGAREPVELALALMAPDLPGAEALVRKYLAGKPLPELRMGYARKLLQAERETDARAESLHLTRSAPDYAPGWLLRGTLEFQAKNPDAARTSLLRYIQLDKADTSNEPSDGTDRGPVQAYLLLAQIEEGYQRWDEAQRYLSLITSPEDVMRVQIRRANILARQGKVAEGRALIRGIAETRAEDARGKISAEAQLLRDNKLFGEAYEVLRQALVAMPQDTDLAYDLAMAAEKLGKSDEMEILLRRVIAERPDYHHAYNALGYSLADRGVRLDEARTLVAKALSFAPDDPYIVDSMAWVEFRSGNAETALRLLQEAFKRRPDAEIAAHLGEVLWHLNQQQKARAAWKEGLELKQDNETLLETMRRLTKP